MSFKRKLFSFHWSKRRESLDFEEVKMRYQNVFFKILFGRRPAGQVFDFPFGKVLTEVAITRSELLLDAPLPIFLPLCRPINVCCRQLLIENPLNSKIWIWCFRRSWDAPLLLEALSPLLRPRMGGVVCRKQNQPLVAQGSTSGRGRPNWEYRRLKSQLPGIIQACKN